jgi:Methyltransferase domain
LLRALAKKVVPRETREWLRGAMRRARRAQVRSLLKLSELVGLNVARRRDFYSPLPSLSQLRRTMDRWFRPSALAGICFDIEAMKGRCDELIDRYGHEFAALPSYDELTRVGYGPGFTAVDALTQYCMLRDLRPKRYLEVGSGLSTYYASLAGRGNAADGRPLAITCIEPFPYKKLYEIPDVQSVIVSEVQSVDLSIFGVLEAGDVLFIDSSHVVRLDGDVPFLFLEVLPRLAKGVVVHVHDIPFPFNVPYPPEYWVFGTEWPYFWTEAMLVQAFLAFNGAFRIALSLPLLRFHDEGFLKARIPGYKTVQEDSNPFSSLWMEKVC